MLGYYTENAIEGRTGISRMSVRWHIGKMGFSPDAELVDTHGKTYPLYARQTVDDFADAYRDYSTKRNERLGRTNELVSSDD